MTDRWNLINPKAKEATYTGTQAVPRTQPGQPKQAPRSEMIMLEEEEAESKKKEVAEKLYERKKRNFLEMQKNYTGAKQTQYSPMKNLSHIVSDKEKVLKVKMESTSSMPMAVPSLKSNVDTKMSKNEAMKVMAGEGIEKFMHMDAKMVELDRFFSSGGLHPFFTKKTNTNYLVKNKIKYPDILFNVFNEKEAKFSFSGLFVPLSLLYFVRDNIIYLWDYNNDVIYTYKEVTNVIVNLHITLPKAGIFSQEVSYIMIVATVSEVFLVLIIIDSEARKLSFIKSDFVYDVSYVVTAICSTSERRIFLGSQNNYLYELDYTNTFSFFGFSKKAKKITHSSQSFLEKIVPNVFNFKKYSYMSKMSVDNTRHILYVLIYFTRNENTIFNVESIYDSTVHIYDLGADGTDFQKLGEITQNMIKERYLNMNVSQQKKEASFVILDVFPITRADSKVYNLIIVTKNGIRAYITFDTYYDDQDIANEEQINEFDKNKIYRIRPSMKYLINLKQIPEPSNATIIEGLENENAFRALQRSLVYNQTYFLDRKFFIFYKDDFKRRSYIDTIEFDEALSSKQQDILQLTYSQMRNREIISNILKFDVNKELYSIVKLPSSVKGSVVYEYGLNNLLKLIEYENIVPRNINFIDSLEHVSLSCMHTFAKQIFLPPEEIVVMTSSELVMISKLRPIDNLFRILLAESEMNLNVGGQNYGISAELQGFINEFGISETTSMLWAIVCNRNFIFYRKFEENVQNDSLSADNIMNQSNILMMDSTELKNNQRTMDIALNVFLRLIEYTIRGLGEKKGGAIETRAEQKVEAPGRNIIGQVAMDTFSTKINYITYALYMYIARVARLFWEEHIYTHDISADASSSRSIITNISETLKLHQIKYLINLVSEFQNKLKENQERILRKASEVDIKIRTYVMGPKQFSQETLNLNFADFSNLPNEYLEVVYLSEKFIESLRFVEILYELNSLKRHLLRQPSSVVKEMISVKFKDIVLNTNLPMVKQWVEEYFEAALLENDFLAVGGKLDELAQICPNIINKNERELITANMLIRLGKSKQSDEISRKNLIMKAVNLMNQNPENVKLEKTVKVLAELGEVRAIVNLCVKKAIYLKALLEREGERNLSLLENTSSNLKLPGVSKSNTMSQADKEVCFNEYKQCLYTVLKLLNEIHQAIKQHDKKDFTSSAPEHIRALLQNKKLTLEDKMAMHTAVIEEILKYDIKFLHDLLFDHLKSQDMLEDIVKYNSPYIEPYLAAQIEKERANPKRYEALYKFFLNSKNYDGALRILLQLINFDNANLVPEDPKYVRLEDRRNYAKHLLYTLDYLMEAETDDSKKNTYLKIKEEVSNMSDSYLIQHDIMIAMHNLWEKASSEGRGMHVEEAIKDAIYNLDRVYYDLIDLYHLFGKKFNLFDVNFQIFFEMAKKNFAIDEAEVKHNYDSYFDQITKERVKWPHIIFPLMNSIFINLFETKTQYDSFPAMLRENGYRNTFHSIIPLDYLILKIENFNWNYLTKEKNVDFEEKSSLKFDAADNLFWFPLFLRDVVKIPCFFIFNLYNQLYTTSTDDPESFMLTLSLIQIIKLWSLNVEIYIDRTEKRDTRIPKFIIDDYTEFIKIYGFLQETLKDFYVYYSGITLKALLDEDTRKRVVAFCQSVENKLQFVINYYIKMSKRSFEQLNLQSVRRDYLGQRDERTNRQFERKLERGVKADNEGKEGKEGKDARDAKDAREDIFQSKKQPYIIKSNILEQCD